METRDLFIAIGMALFAVFGQCANWLNLKDRKQQTFMNLLSGSAAAAFAGMLVYCVHAWIDFNVFGAFALAGVAGWAGVKGVNLMNGIITRRTGLMDKQAER